jgi:hypothetical protein
MKPNYSKGLLIVDIILTLFTTGFWLIVVILRELYRANKAK